MAHPDYRPLVALTTRTYFHMWSLFRQSIAKQHFDFEVYKSLVIEIFKIFFGVN